MRFPALFLFVLALAKPLAAAPRLACDQPVFQFGEIDNREPVHHTFTLRNAGDQPLVIQSVKPSCGCTEATLADDTLDPGESTTLELILTLHGKTGPMSKGVVLGSNDPDQPFFTINMVGTAYAPLTATPAAVAMRVVKPTDADKSVELSVRAGTTMQLSDAKALDDRVTVMLQTVKPGQAYRLRVGLKGPLEPGTVRTAVRVTTDAPGLPTFDVPVVAVVVGDLSVSDEALTLSPGEKDAERFVIVSAGRVKQFKITKIDPPAAGVGVKVFKAGPLGYRIRFFGLQGTEAMQGREAVIHTDAPGMARIVLPVRVVAPDDAATQPAEATE